MSDLTMRVAVTVTLAVLLPGCSGFGSGEDATASVSVPVSRGEMRISVPALGELSATIASPIGVPRVPTGALKVKELAAEGTIVEAGDVVVVFDDTELNIELGNHKASFRSADRRIDRTGLQSEIESGAIEIMKRVAELERENVQAFEIVDTEIYSRQEIVGDEVRLDNAEETIVFADLSLLLRGEFYDIEERILGVEKDQVQGKLERVQYSLGQLLLRAPIGGLIVYKKNWRGATVGVGDSLWPGNVILSIVDPASTELKGFVLERDAAGLTKGAEARVRVDARPDLDLAGRVTTVAEVSRPIERGSPVKYTEVRVEILDAPVGLLMPGMKAEAKIVTGSVDSALIIPRSTVRGDADSPYVLVQGTTGSERRPVKLGPGDLVRVSVEEGLTDGDRVLLGEEAGAAETASIAPGQASVPGV